MPSTVARCKAKARETWGKAHDAAAEEYGDGERAHRTAFSALKHTHEKVGDHWEAKRPARATSWTWPARLDVSGRSRMTKGQLVDAIRRANDRETARSRS